MSDKALLWRLSKKQHPDSYLFGTMHVRDNAAFSFTDTVLKYINECQYYYGEIDLDEASEQLSPENYLMPDHLDIRQILPERKYKRMHKHALQILNFDLEPWTRFYPLVICNRMAETILMEDNSMALDSYLWIKASEAGKNLGGIEKVSDQLQLMQTLDLDTQIQMLKKICLQLSKYRKSILQLKKYYETQDIKRLYKESLKSLGSFRHSLLYERNIQMAEFIDSCSGRSAFFTMGAAHLAGNKGVLRLLKKKEFKLKPVKLERNR